MKIVTTYSNNVLVSVPDFMIDGISAELMIQPASHQCELHVLIMTKMKEQPKIEAKYDLMRLFFKELTYTSIMTKKNENIIEEYVIPGLLDLIDAVSDEFINWIIGSIHAEIIPSRVLYDYRDKEYLADREVYFIEDTLREKIFDFGLFLVYLPTMENRFYLKGIISIIKEEGIDEAIEKFKQMYIEKARSLEEQSKTEGIEQIEVDLKLIKEELSERLKTDAMSLYEIVTEYRIDSDTAESILKDIGAIFVPQLGEFVILSGDDIISAYEKLKQKLLERREWKISMDEAIRMLTEEGLSPDMASAYIIKMIQMRLVIDKEGLLDFIEVRRELLGENRKEKEKEENIQETLKELDEFAKTEARTLSEMETPEEMVERIKQLAEASDKKKFVMIMKRVLSYLYSYNEEKFIMLMNYLEEHYETSNLAVLYTKLK